MSYYASAEAKLSGAPPVRVFENWCSTLLDTWAGDYILDNKPKKEITTIISDIRQIDPDAELFEIPKEYKIISTDAKAPAANAKDSQHPSTPN